MSTRTHLSAGTPAPRFFMYSAPGRQQFGDRPVLVRARGVLGQHDLRAAPSAAEVVAALAPDGHPGPAGGHLHGRTGLGAAGRRQARRRPCAPSSAASAAPPVVGDGAAAAGAAAGRHRPPVRRPRRRHAPPLRLCCCTTIACQPPTPDRCFYETPPVPHNDGLGPSSRGRPGARRQPQYRGVVHPAGPRRRHLGPPHHHHRTRLLRHRPLHLRLAGARAAFARTGAYGRRTAQPSTDDLAAGAERSPASAGNSPPPEPLAPRAVSSPRRLHGPARAAHHRCSSHRCRLHRQEGRHRRDSGHHRHAATTARGADPATATATAPRRRPDWTALARGLDGKLVRPGDAAYRAARQLYNTRFDSLKPAAVAYVAGADDVKECLAYARAHRTPVSIRNGGHSYAGWSSGNGRLVIDVSSLNRVAAGRLRSAPAPS